MMAKTPVETCPDCGSTRTTSVEPHIEGRFGRLESDVRGLKESHEHLEGVVTRGFDTMRSDFSSKIDTLFNKLDGVRTDFSGQIERRDTLRSSEVVGRIANAVAIVILVVGLLYQSLSGIGSAIARSETAAATGIAKAESALALANTRELQYREDKGKSDERTSQTITNMTEFRRTYEKEHESLDKKLQNETALTREVLSASIKGLDDKVQVEFKGRMTDIDHRIDDHAAQLTAMRDWRLKHVEDVAYSHGEQDAQLAELRKDQKTIEERQYINTGMIHDNQSKFQQSQEGCRGKP
jgi:hypothetical protein